MSPTGSSPDLEKLRLRPVTSENRSEAVVEQLAEQILSGELPAGSPLPSERNLSLSLGVSRNVLREATKILQSRGLVTIRHGARTIVNGSTSGPVQQAVLGALYGRDDAVLQLTEVRLMLEVGIAHLAAQRASKKDIAALRDLMQKLHATVEDSALYIEWDVAFHRALADATHNAIFSLMFDSIAELLRQSRAVALAHESPISSLAQHQQIFDAVAARDAARAGEAMRQHLELQRSAFEDMFQTKK